MPTETVTDPSRIAFPETIPPRHRAILLETLSDHFALRQSTCHRRACRRAGACCGARESCGRTAVAPPCIGNLGAADAAEIGHIVDILAEIHAGSIWLSPATNERPKWRQDQAIAVMRAALPRMPEHEPHFRRWYARFTEPPIDTAKFLLEAQAELARAEVTLGLFEMKEKMRR